MATQTEYDEILRGGKVPSYEYTILVDDTEEILSVCTFGVITDITQATVCNVECVGHGLTGGEKVYIHSAGGMTQINNRYFYANKIDADNFTLYKTYKNGIFVNPVDSAGYTAYTTGGYWIVSKPIKCVSFFHPFTNANLSGTGFPGACIANKPGGAFYDREWDDLAKVVVIGKAGDKIAYELLMED